MLIFNDIHRSPLKHVSLRNSTITDRGMKYLLQHNLTSLSMWYCDSVTTNSWQTLCDHSSRLQILELGKYVDLIKYSEPNEKDPIDFQLNLPELRRLTLNAVVLQPTLQFSHLKNLSHLDLTACIFAEFSIEALVDLPNLSSLILFNVWPLEYEIPILCKFLKLHTLDISTTMNSGTHGNYKNPNRVSEFLIVFVFLLPYTGWKIKVLKTGLRNTKNQSKNRNYQKKTLWPPKFYYYLQII